MTDVLVLSSSIAVPLSEISISYIRSPGPGGQNVNKVATAAQLRFGLMASPSLPEPVRRRAADLAGSRLTTEGEIVITASRHRTQQMNRDDALDRLAGLLREALYPPKPRRATRPTLASKRRRLEGKAQRGKIKQLRASKPGLD
jgi:ribosome-associated protein